MGIDILGAGGNMVLASAIITWLMERGLGAELKPKQEGAWEVRFGQKVVLVRPGDDVAKTLGASNWRH